MYFFNLDLCIKDFKLPEKAHYGSLVPGLGGTLMGGCVSAIASVKIIVDLFFPSHALLFYVVLC